MTTENGVPFKAYLLVPGQETQVRRFAIERDAVSNFTYLNQKLFMVFPALQNTGLKIYWKDSEGDNVQICNDEELLIFLSESAGVNKKLYVVPRRSGSHLNFGDFSFFQTSNNDGAVAHAGVVCDACDSPVVGNRYKCVICPDYDLCAECEQKQLHKEHVMFRIPFPITTNPLIGHKMLKEMCKFSKHMEKAAFHGMKHWGGHHGKDKHGHGHGHGRGHGKHGNKHGQCPFAQNLFSNPPQDAEPSSGEETKEEEEQLDLIGLMNRFLGQNREGISDLAKRVEINIRPPEGEDAMETTSQKEAETVSSKSNETPAPASPDVNNGASTSNGSKPSGPIIMETEDGWSLLNSQSKVDESLEKMLSMGFKNEGGWLRDMLASTNGDISKVVDKLMGNKFA